MRKFTLFLLSMFCILGAAVAQDNSDGTFKLESSLPNSKDAVTSVDYIQLVFSKDVEVTLPEGGIEVVNNDTKEVHKLVSRNEYAPANYVVLNFEYKQNDKGDMEPNVIKKEGSYSYTIPAGVIRSVDGEEFPETTFSFTVSNPFKLVYSNPSSDVPVSSVNFIQLEFSKEVTVELPAAPIIIKHKESSDEFEVVNGNAYGKNAIFYLQKVTESTKEEDIVTAITAIGTYTYTIPAGVIKSIEGEEFPEQTFTFTISEPFEIVNVTPDENGTNKLDKIQITFSQEIEKIDMPASGLVIVDLYWMPVTNIKKEVTLSDDNKTVTFELEAPITTPGNYNLDLYNGIFVSKGGMQNQYTTLTFKVIDYTPSFSTNLKDGDRVEEINNLEITFQNVKEVKLVDANAVVAYLPGDGESVGTAKLANNVITVTFDQEMSEEGVYTFYIPEGMFTMDGVPNEAREFSVTLYKFRIIPLEIVSVTPEEGTVAQLDKIIIEFNQDVTLSMDENWQQISREISLKCGDKEYILTYNSDSNIGHKLEYLVNANWTGYEYESTPIVEEGTYILDLSDIIVDHAAEDYMDEWGYPSKKWHEKSKRCEGTVKWIIGIGDTSIGNVEVENGKQVIYDLTGRRIENLSGTGIYIVNGKKVIIK
ncbi:MAG: hypothetical protein IKD40_02170 [Bacteroidaceae bacterium]|nr:hypothetical protein [Bacteroidaceae bacterium]